MASDKITPLEINERRASTTEDEVQIATDSMDTKEPEKTDMETELTATEFADASHEKAGGSEAIEEGSNTAGNPESGYPTGIRFALLTISLMLAVFMVALDTNIICLPPSHPLPFYPLLSQTHT
jgi:hypothetical protein